MTFSIVIVQIQNVLEANSFRNIVIIILYSEDGKRSCKCDVIHGNEPTGSMMCMEFLDWLIASQESICSVQY